jgi:hypothetical protein
MFEKPLYEYDSYMDFSALQGRVVAAVDFYDIEKNKQESYDNAAFVIFTCSDDSQFVMFHK